MFKKYIIILFLILFFRRLKELTLIKNVHLLVTFLLEDAFLLE